MSPEEEIQDLRGQVGILANAIQYMEAKVQAAYDMVKPVWDYQSSREEFRDWYQVEHVIKNLPKE